MANQEQLKILKEEGVKSWKKWREDNPDLMIDLNDAHLSDTNLVDANLVDASLGYANLNKAFLSKANLTNAYLHAVQALGTNFDGATLTGACIQDWNINSETNFENVICDYIYLKQYEKERRPSDPNRNFEPGEFAKLIEKSVETVDLIFSNGIDWKAFLSSYQDIQVKYGEQNVSIQAIEQKGGETFVIRLNVPPEVNKAEIESQINHSYETELKVLKAQFKGL